MPSRAGARIRIQPWRVGYRVSVAGHGRTAGEQAEPKSTSRREVLRYNDECACIAVWKQTDGAALATWDVG